MKQLARFFPFLNWFPLKAGIIRADLLAGIAVALVLIPQSMAYAQLAGLPAYYGLYAAFLPVIVAAMWGSSAQLASGPVAMVSILTAAALMPLAVTGSEDYIALAILLALMVGVIQLTMGLFKLGSIVNFISHPVIVGFVNAAAIIIALSQLSKILGVPMYRSEHFIQDIWGVLQQIGDTHMPTLIMGVSAFAVMLILKRVAPKLPGVLFAVIITTIVSWSIGFEHNGTGKIADIADVEVKTLANKFSQTENHINELNSQVINKSGELNLLHKSAHAGSQQAVALNYKIELLKLELKDAEAENRKRERSLRKFIFERVPANNDRPAKLYLAGSVPANEKTDEYRWHIAKIKSGEFQLVGGGAVIGNVPAGLPSFEIPKFSLDMFMALLASAFVISMVGFMEANAMAKAMAAKTKQRLDSNQELIGQGLANIVGAFTKSFPVSGSFSRSAVNLNAGALTSMSSVFTFLIVFITLLFLTPLLYHLPQAVLAAVIMMAVVGLVNFKAIKHAWQTHIHDGIAAVITFVATLAFAPHMDKGIMIGAGLAIILYLYRTMKPRVAILGRHQDGTLRDVKIHNLPVSDYIIAIRYDGSLYFANVPYFEDTILEAIANNPRATHMLIVANGINQLDASGDEVIHHIVERLRANGIRVVFSGLKKQVLDIMRNSGLLTFIKEENIFPDEDKALAAIYLQVLAVDPDAQCCLARPA